MTSRILVFAVTVVAAISSSTAVIGLDQAEIGTAEQPSLAVSAQAVAATPMPALQPMLPGDPCRGTFEEFCSEVALPQPAPPDVVQACTLGVDHAPLETLATVTSMGGTTAEDSVRVQIQVEDGLEIDRECFATEVLNILNDERGWVGVEDASFVAVDDDSYDLRLVLASPATTDSLCYPARTSGEYSCRNRETVVINLMRWQSATDDYTGDMTTYRRYLINHEVGHFLGKGHLSCPAPGEPAPVMMQQTKGLGECLPNGWPTKDEH